MEQTREFTINDTPVIIDFDAMEIIEGTFEVYDLRVVPGLVAGAPIHVTRAVAIAAMYANEQRNTDTRLHKEVVPTDSVAGRRRTGHRLATLLPARPEAADGRADELGRR